MRFLLLGLLALAACSPTTSYVPRQDGRISVVMHGGPPAYVRDGRLYQEGQTGDDHLRGTYLAGTAGCLGASSLGLLLIESAEWHRWDAINIFNDSVAEVSPEKVESRLVGAESRKEGAPE